MKVNFFWKGSKFGFFQYIVIKSHHKVAHEPIVWLSGEKPVNHYWKDLENFVTIKNANEIFDVSEFLENGGNMRTAADLWRFHFLYNFGGLYCDTDAFALKKFPDDEWIVCSGEKDSSWLSIGIIKAPPHHEIFLECISNIKKDWDNVEVFSKSYGKFFGNTNPTHDNKLFYPYKWDKWKNLFKKNEIPKQAYSIHFYGKKIEEHIKKKGVIYNETWCQENPKTLLSKLWNWLKEAK